MPKRSPVLIPLLAVAALLFGACSSDSDDSSGSDDGGGDESTEVALVNDGQLTVCSDMPYIPFEFEEDGETKGFDYDVVSAMATEMDLDVEFRTTPFDTIIPAVAAGDCDMIASAMTITPEREENALFTEPYFDADQSLLVKTADAETYASLEDLAGQVIGVQSETTGAAYAEENLPEGATVRAYETGDALFGAMTSNDIQAALQDFPVNQYRALAEPDQFVVTETFPTEESYGFAVAKDNTALQAQLNDALSTIRDNGTYDEIYAEWFGDQS